MVHVLGSQGPTTHPIAADWITPLALTIDAVAQMTADELAAFHPRLADLANEVSRRRGDGLRWTSADPVVALLRAISRRT